jgi:outer membrane protein TolC
VLRRGRARSALLLAFATLCSATQAHDLVSAYRYALDDDRRVAISRAQLAGANARSDESRAALLPQVALRAGASRNDET